jgi:hypothetical protein
MNLSPTTDLRVIIVKGTSPTLLELWRVVQAQLQRENYTVLTATVELTPDFGYDNLCKIVERDDYDVVVGEFSIFPERLAFVQFSLPIKAIESVVMQRKHEDENWVEHTLRLFIKYYLPMVVSIFIIGIIVYYIIYYICIRLDVNIQEWISSLFGCFMYVHDVRLTKKYNFELLRSSFVFAVLLIISAFTYSLLNAHITSKMIVNEVRANDITPFNVRQQHILCPVGVDAGRTLVRYGATVDAYHGDTNTAVNDFMHHPDYQHYNGIALYDDAGAKYASDLRRSKAVFGMNVVCFAVHKKHTSLLRTMNRIIAQHNVDLVTYKGCLKEGVESPTYCVL